MAPLATKNLRNIKSMRHQTSKSAPGFTLVEVLIIAPIVILAIGAFVAIMVSVVGEVLVTRNTTSQTNDIHGALDQIEQDVKLSLEFPVTTGSLPSPQGRNNNFTGTSAFTSADPNTLVLQTAATSFDGIMYYANQPNPCPEVDFYYYPNVVYNRVFTITNMYFVKDGALWKRTYVPTYNLNVTSPDQSTLCSDSNPRERNTCSPGYTASRCQTQDTKLIENVTALSTAFFATGDSTTNVGAGNSATATTVEVSITASTKSAGEPIATTMKRRMSKLDQANPTSTTSRWAYWPAGDGTGELQNGWKPYESGFAEPGYIKTSGGVVFLKGLIKNGTTTNGTTVAVLPPAYRPSTRVTVPVTARSSAGANESAVIQIQTNGDIQIWYVDAHATLPWVSLDGVGFLLDSEYPMTNLVLQNGWTKFLDREVLYGVDSMGRTHIRGQFAPGTTTSNTVISQLPSARRPDKYYHFMGGAPSNQYVHYAINNTGAIVARGFSSSWQGFGAIFYPYSFTGWTYWTPPPGTGTYALQNSWDNYSSTYPSASYTKAADGIVSLRGLIGGGSTSSSSLIARLPPGYRPAEKQIFDVTNNADFARVDVWPTGEIVVNSVSSNGWLGLNDIQFVAEQ